MNSQGIVYDLSFEHQTPGDCLGIGYAAPRLSWKIRSSSPFRQTAYQVEVSFDGGDRRTLTVEGDRQVLVPWPVEPLRSRQRAVVRVRVAGEIDGWGPWSSPAAVEAGLLHERDWTARFITPEGIADLDQPAPELFHTFHVKDRVMSARLYITAHGVFRATINGRVVTDSVLDPGWTSYPHRLRYRTLDVTDLIRSGENTISSLVGDGWYRGYLKWESRRAHYGSRLALCAQLEITTESGKRITVGTDEEWRARSSAVVSADLYNGTIIDYRVDLDDSPIMPVRVVESGTERLVAPDGPSILPVGTMRAQRIWKSPSGKTLVDFGQNAVGWVRLHVRGLAPDGIVTVRHAEVLEHDELGVRPLRAAKATDTYILDGPDPRTLEPVFTLHGFRYAEVTGIDDLMIDDVEFVVVGTALSRIGWFVCSNDLLNRLHDNVVWSTRSNFIDIPTDCPQRDERLGWTGDIQVFSPTALELFDVSGLLVGWLKDLAAEQYPDGGVPHVIPNPTFLEHDPAACAWGDAAVVVPWNIYLSTGDDGILKRQLPSMTAWVDRVNELAGDNHLWQGGFQFGDWLDPTAPPDEPGKAKADPDVVATGCFARCAQIVADAAEAIGEKAISVRYGMLAALIRDAFVEAYVDDDGRIASDAQTVYALSLQWGLLADDRQRDGAGRRLAALVREGGFHIGTGFVGTPLLCDALTEAGYPDLAWRLLNQTECPSWLYPVTMGATTIWERWDSMLPDGTINPGEMTSFNHYSLGAVVDWMNRCIAGLAPEAPGYRRIRVAPHCFEGLDYVSAHHDCPYGRIAVDWRRTGDGIELRVNVPVGVTAQVRLPGSDETEEPIIVGNGEWVWHTRSGRVIVSRPCS
ncbi:alpha-L-rhamnosidase [Bifidobacterium margollesii]|uniref:alpha-L-rhamnosidase n=1 Tax=Bifidobacterium margollesii TaxID=2020964 RepID=A0A2N5JAD2_9BIFI|nr:alpha-L-rhamnosidase [Bifidobacterium margollesii]PLS31177.1 alpha-L-rhamnosidase [Bifidobacterium margollesii]